VLHIGDIVVGFAWVSLHTERAWCFGNYLGIVKGWRRNAAAADLKDAVTGRAKASVAGLKGMLFEVDPVDTALLEQVAVEVQRGKHLRECERWEDVKNNLRRLRRLNWYQLVGAKMLLREDGRPLPYWQPSMKEVLRSADERDLHLMVYLFDPAETQEFNIASAIDFIYDDLYREAYAGEGNVQILGFADRVSKAKGRVVNALQGGWRLGKLSVTPSVHRLMRRAEEEGLAAELDL